MKKNLCYALCLLGAISLLGTGCNTKKSEAETDSISANDSLPELKGDSKINKAARFYAGLNCEGVEMSKSDSLSWSKYNQTLKQMLTRSDVITVNLDSIARTDFSDLRDTVDYVFYPFSGADFVYPTLIYPDADTYFLCGLENTGTPISGDIKTNYEQYEAYRNALRTFFHAGFFVTKDMHNDLHNKELDGVCPVISMLMAIRGYEIISIKHVQINEAGDFVEAASPGNALEFKFFKSGSRHEQTLYYMSGNVKDNYFDANMKKYLEKTLPIHTVGTYMKAASFILHDRSFSIMRDYVLNNSYAIIQDDTGVPYRFLKDKFDVTLYGTYGFPSVELFGPGCGQPDLDELYKKNAANIHPLPFMLGYKNSHNIICARRKAGQ